MIGLDELRYALETGDLTAAETIALTDLEKRAVAFVEQATRRYFGPTTTFAEVLEGRGRDTLFLNEAPGSITTVEERAEVGDTWVAITDYELRASRLLRAGGCVWTTGYEYRVTYDFGYTGGQEPGEIRQLVIDLVKLKWDLRSSDVAVQSERVGPEAVTYHRGEFTSDLAHIPWVRETLDAWRWTRVA